MTLVVAVIDPNTGAISLGADTKVTFENDATLTRKIYTEPALKIVLLGEDLAVGYAGEGPETIATRVSSLHGLPVEEVLDGLARIPGASFVVAHRSPARIWAVSSERGVEDRTAIRRAWVGDREAYEAFQTHFDDFANDSALFRLQSTMQGLVHLVRPDSIGGYVVLSSGSAEKPFRFLSMESMLWPEAPSAEVDYWTARAAHAGGFTVRATYSEPPLVLRAAPGAAPTAGALGLYVENAEIGYLYPHLDPARRVRIQASSIEEFAKLATEEHGQSLST